MSAPTMDKLIHTDAGGETLPYRLLRPDAATGARFPLVLFLHGAGERGDDNERQLIHVVPKFLTPEVRRDFPCFLAAPQCPLEQKWADVEWSAPSHAASPQPSRPMRLAIDLLDKLTRELPVDLDRVYVSGISMGGYGTWDLITRQPQRFAAAVPICGGGDETLAPRIASLPIWCFHGEQDTAVPVRRSRQMIAAVRAAGGSPRYTEYPNEGHGSWVPAYEEPELLPWMFAQKRA